MKLSAVESPLTDKAAGILVLCACLVVLVMGFLLAVTQLPLCDEGFYGVPASVLSTTGAMTNPVLESAGVSNLRGIDRVFYWMAPLAIVLQAAAFKIFGLGLLVQRGLSVVCGLGAVLLWYSFLRHIVTTRVAALAAILLSADYVFLILASRGRADMISLLFGMAALAAYTHWRERDLSLALALSNTACALSGMAHPNGGVACFLCLAVLTIYLDRSRLGWRHVVPAVAGYAVLGTLWGIYILKAPDLFAAQFFGNVQGRLGTRSTPVSLIKGEVTRYMSAYGLVGAHGMKLMRWLIPVSYLTAVGACTASAGFRKRHGVLLWMFVAVSLSLVFLEGAKQGWYLVHVSPLFAAFLAIFLARLWAGRSILGHAVGVAQVAIVLFGLLSLTFSATNRNRQRLFQPVVSFLNAHLAAGDVVFARSEFYFGLDCRSCLRDDERLGAISGRHAAYVVVDPDYEGQWAGFQEASPDTYRRVEQQLTGYREVFRNSNYRVLESPTAR